MARINLTPRFIRSRRPAKSGQRDDYPDALVPGLALRVTDKGHKSFVLVARYPLKPKNPTRRALGDTYIPPDKAPDDAQPDPEILNGALTLADARTKARQWLDLISRGIDPKVEEERQRAAQARRQANTWAAVVADYLDQHCKGLAKEEEARATLEREMGARWSARPITDITPLEISAAIKAIKDRGAVYGAHNAFGWVRGLYNWAIGTGVYGVESSPVERLSPKKLIGTKEPRTRILNDAELRAVWEATGRIGYPYAPLVRLLILTGQRENEVGGAPRAEFDFNGALWVIPPERMKAAIGHSVPLAPKALALFQSVPLMRHLAVLEERKDAAIDEQDRAAIDAEIQAAAAELAVGPGRISADAWRAYWSKGKFIFTTTDGLKPVNGFGKAKDRIDVELMRSLVQQAAPQPGLSLQPSGLSVREKKSIRIVAKGHDVFAPTDALRVIGIRHGDRWGYARVNEFISPREVEARILRSFESTNPSDTWVKGPDPWKFHDLRRTMRTHLSALPVQDLVRELVIAHTKPGLHKVYDQFAYLDEKRECLDLWEKRLVGILEPPPPAGVTDLSKARAERQAR